MPKLPQNRPPAPEIPTLPLALLMGLAFGGGFLALLTIILPGAGALFFAALLFLAFFWLQYVVWGRRLYDYVIRKEREADQSVDSDDAPSGSR